MKGDFLELYLKLIDFLYFIWDCIKGVFDIFITDLNNADKIEGYFSAFLSPLRAVDFVYYDSSEAFFYYFFTNSFTLIIFGLLQYFRPDRYILPLPKFIKVALFVLIFISVKEVGSSVVFSGGVIAMSGYFYPESIVQYLGFMITFTFSFPHILFLIPFIPFTGFLGFVHTITRVVYDIKKVAYKYAGAYSSLIPIGIDTNGFNYKRLNRNLLDGF